MILAKRFIFPLSLLGMLMLGGLRLAAADNGAGTEHGLRENSKEALERYYEEVAQKKHETLALYYEEEEKKNQAKAQELRRLLEHYSEKSYIYGKRAQDLQAHTDALLSKHMQAARMDAAEAASHRQIALKLKDKINSAPRIQNVSVIEKSAQHPSLH